MQHDCNMKTYNRYKDYFQDLEELKYILQKSNYSRIHLIQYLRSELYRQKLGKALIFKKFDKNITRKRRAWAEVKRLKAEYAETRAENPAYCMIPIHHLTNIFTLSVAEILTFIEASARKMRAGWLLLSQLAIANTHNLHAVTINRAMKFLISRGLIQRLKLPYYVKRKYGGKYLINRYFSSSKTFYQNVNLKLNLLDITNLTKLLSKSVQVTAPPRLTFKEMLAKKGLNFNFKW